MRYVLDQWQIEEIIKEQKFDENKYAEFLSSYDFTVVEVLERYSEKFEIPLVKNKNEIYEELTDIGLALSDYVYSELIEEIENLTEDGMRRLEEQINEGVIK